MHVLDIIAIVIIGLLAVIGAGKGFIKTVFGLLSAVLAVVVASIFAGEFGKMLYGFSLGGPSIGENLLSGIKGSFQEQGGFLIAVPEGGYTVQHIIEVLETLGIPAILGGFIAAPVAEALAPYGDVALIDVLAPIIVDILLSIVAFVILYIIVWAVITAIAGAIRRAISTISLVKSLDNLLGLILGALKGCILVWVVLAFSSLFTFIPGMNELIQSTVFVKWLADNNVITLLITSGFDIESAVMEILSGLPIPH